MEIPLDAILLPKNADHFHEELAVHLTENRLVFHILKGDHYCLSFDESILPDLVDALIELQNKK